MSAIKPSHEKLQYVRDAGYPINYSCTSKDIKNWANMEYVRGSGKYDSDTIIISSTSAKNCICRNICNCAEFCYARRDEKAHGQKVGDFKDRQGFEFLNTPNELIVSDFLQMMKNFRKPIKYIRFNEAGDLSKEFLLKAYDLFLKFQRQEELRDIVFFTYTHNYKLYDLIEKCICEGFIVNNSYNPQAEEQRTLSNNFIAVEPHTYKAIKEQGHNLDKYNIVLCDCDKKCGHNCDYCQTSNGLNIVEEIH